MATRIPLFRNSLGLMQGFASGDDLDMQTGKILNLADPTSAQDAATKAYVDSIANGLHWHAPAEYATTANIDLTTNGLAAVDGTALIAGQRILVKNQTTPTQNGIYIAAVGAWARASDMATGYNASASAVWVRQGTANADTAWVETADPAVVDTNPLTFTQFGAAGVYTAGNGIDITAFQISVDLATDPGLEFNAGQLQVKAGDGINRTANGVEVGLSATPGLEFSAGDLQVKNGNGIAVTASGVEVDLAATPGLEFNAGQLRVKVDTVATQTIYRVGDGIGVIGLPQSFELIGTPVSANVTAVSLDALVDGATAVPSLIQEGLYHDHDRQVQHVGSAAGGGVAALDVVYISADDTVGKAQANADATARAVGIAVAAYGAGATNPYFVSSGVVDMGGGLTAGTYYYLSTSSAGALQSTAPSTAGQRVIYIGQAMTTTKLLVNIQDLGTV